MDRVCGQRDGDGRHVAGVYLLVCLLFATVTRHGRRLILALIPQRIVWSATAAVEPTASLALVLALLCARTMRVREGLPRSGTGGGGSVRGAVSSRAI